ncbi:Mss4-like protein [Crassisporium funariophilum]|nr:Mss4-like protein [Crassisporium funariophilum]
MSGETVTPSTDDNVENTVHRGGCYCKSVEYEVKGSPILSAYCHCTLCQRLNAAAFILTIHFASRNFIWTHPEPHGDALDSYSVPIKPWKTRWRCKNCGCTVASFNSKANKWSVWGAQLERGEDGKIIGWDTVKPTAHIFYDTRMVDVKDDLGKWAGYEDKSERLS